MAHITIDDQFEIVRGEQKAFYFQVMQTDKPDSLPFNLTGYTVTFAMNADGADEGEALLLKSTDVIGEGDILTPADGTGAIYFVSADTLASTLGTYQYELWLTKSPDVDERLWTAPMNIVKRIRPWT